MYPTKPFTPNAFDEMLVAAAAPCRALMENPMTNVMLLPMTIGMMIAVNSYFSMRGLMGF